jgi:hypothetical protein
MTTNEERIIGSIRAALERHNCPAEFLQDRAQAMAAHDASNAPNARVAVVEEDVLDSTDPDGRRWAKVARVRVVDRDGTQLYGVGGEPMEVERFVRDFIYHNPGFRWTLNPLVG